MRRISLLLALFLFVPDAAADAQQRGQIATLRRLGQSSGAEENVDHEPDEPADVSGFTAGFPRTVRAAAGRPLRELQNAQALAQSIAAAFGRLELDVALLGGQKYMVSNCLGLKASAGRFNLRLGEPSVRIDQLGLATTFRIDRVELEALKVRWRPSGKPTAMCSFSAKHAVEGVMKNVTLELRWDPIIDMKTCTPLGTGIINATWRIGGLNLKPLQNDLDRMAKDMIEDALNYFSAAQMPAQLLHAMRTTMTSGNCVVPPGVR